MMIQGPFCIRRAGAVLLLLLLSACSTDPEQSTPVPEVAQQGATITIGDISDEPKKKIDRFQPLADYLATNLSDLGYSTGQVVVASSVDEMIEFVESGKVDVYFDSPFPALTTQANADTEFILRRWKDGDAIYNGVVVADRSTGIQTVEDLQGRIIAAEEPYSTTGFASQAINLVEEGYELEIVDDPRSQVSPHVVGLWFSRDEENTIEAVINGTVAAGFLSDSDLDSLPEELRDQIRVVSESETLPRQVVSIRGDLDERVVARVRSLLAGLEETEEGLQILKQIKTTRFDELPLTDRQRLGDLADYLILLPLVVNTDEM